MAQDAEAVAHPDVGGVRDHLLHPAHLAVRYAVMANPPIAPPSNADGWPRKSLACRSASLANSGFDGSGTQIRRSFMPPGAGGSADAWSGRPPWLRRSSTAAFDFLQVARDLISATRTGRQAVRSKPGQPMTLANMRQNGVRMVTATCEVCGRQADVNVDALPETLTVPEAGRGLRCGQCGGKRVWTRPARHTSRRQGTPDFRTTAAVIDRRPPRIDVSR